MNTTKFNKIKTTITMPAMTEQELIELGKANGFDFENCFYFDGAYWKTYNNPDMEDLILVSTDGRVWDADAQRYCVVTVDGSIGRHRVHLLCTDGRYKFFLRYRLVAECFIPNPDNLGTINHKDENPLNDSLLNLEWMSLFDNINYGTRSKRQAETMRRKTIARHSKAQNPRHEQIS